MNDPIQDLRDVAANVTAHPNHVAIIAAAAVLHLADEFVAFEGRVSRALLDRHIGTYEGRRPRNVFLDHILDEME